MQDTGLEIDKMLTTLNDRITGLGKFIAEGNKRIMDTVLERMPVKQRPKEPMMSPSIRNLNNALSEARKHFKQPAKSKKGARSYYSSYDDLVAATRPALESRGIVVVFMPEANEFNEAALTIVISHDSGEWIRSTMPLHEYSIETAISHHQKIGSALTYLQRYMYNAALGIAGDFDEEEV